MGRIFGTDGARGIVGKELTCELAMQIGRAAAYVLTKHQANRPMLLIGRDTRISSKMLEAALIAGICSVGADTTSIGVVPTPAVAYLVKRYGMDAGIMISASHNPVEFNGIKLFNCDGLKLSDDLQDEIEQYVLDCPHTIPLKIGVDLGRSFQRRSAANDYVRYLMSTIDGDLKGLRIAVDCANGSASATAEQLFKGLGAIPLIMGAEPDGTNINNGCGSTHIERLAEFVRRNKCMGGVAFDGDADRCLAVDEQGNPVDGDQLIAMFAHSLKEQGRLPKDTVVVTVMSNMGFFRFADKEGLHAQTTKVGDRYVLENMLENGYALGGEQSGHIIFKEFANTGDGQLTAIQLLRILRDSDAPFSKLAARMEKFPQVLINLSANQEQKDAYQSSDCIAQYIQQKKDELGENGRILVRLSGTEPLIRIMLEGRDLKEIETIARGIADQIQEVVGQ